MFCVELVTYRTEADTPISSRTRSRLEKEKGAAEKERDSSSSDGNEFLILLSISNTV